MSYFDSINKSPDEHDAFLFFADISGYTQYVKKHGFAWAHGQFIISELLKSLLEELIAPIKVAKLEGDAIFFYLQQDSSLTPEFLSQKLFLFFGAFNLKKQHLFSVNTCNCPCCSSINSLRLKVIVHVGKILIYNLNGFQEISGLDVIMLHRLSKNNVVGKEYLLLTEPAYQKISFFKELAFISGKEKYDEIGEIKTYVHYPNKIEDSNEKLSTTFLARFTYELKLVFVSFFIKMKFLIQRKESEKQI